MSSLELLDNDILLKIAGYDLHDGFAAEFAEPPMRLGVAAFVLSKRIKRSGKLRDKAGVLCRLDKLLAWASKIEPDETEMCLAADIEAEAQSHNISFDAGESLLLAILIARAAKRLHTGDKRAIAGLPQLCQLIDKAEAVAGRIRCFEQVLKTLLGLLGAEVLAAKVCQEPDIDQATSICCRCASGARPTAGEIEAGLDSYVSYLRQHSGSMLAV